MNNNIEELNSLSEEERKLALQILSEYQQKGTSKLYNDLIYDDYKEIPVDIETFLMDDNYLGQSWKDASGKSKIYPFWLEQLKKLFPTNTTTCVNTFIESGARGLGKSEIAAGIIAPYLQYRILCLKNPLEYYSLKPTEKIVFAFMNIKLDLAEEIAVDKYQKTIQMSPWFMNKGRLTSRNNNPYWVPPEPLNNVIGSQSDDLIGKPIFYAFFDEISFIKNMDIEKQKARAIDMIDTAIGGMKTRFIKNGENPTLLVLASSKRSDKSFLEEHIKQKLQSEPDNVIIIDKPVWEVKPKGTYKDEFFTVALGNKYLTSQVINENNIIESDWTLRGYKLIKVPVDFKSNFLDDIDRALCDYAGISSSELSKYISGTALARNITETRLNPFTQEILEIGNAPDDTLQYYNFFDLNRIPIELKSRPLYIHLDMSISGDMTGIAGTFIKGKKPSTDNNQSKDLFYSLAFGVSIKAPKGRQISFEKNRNFIRWLKEQGFRIKEISADTFQSYDLLQQLSAEGFTTSILSVDRTDTDHVCKPYQAFKSAIYEDRFEMFRCERLESEITDLERNINTGKVDHPPNCLVGETKIQLVDGRSVSIIDLLDEFNSGKTNFVYTVNETDRKIEPKKIKNVWCSGHTNVLYKITLDNNKEILCTPQHPFMLRNGSYLTADKLIVGESLMPLYLKVSDKGLQNYRLYYEPFEDAWHYEHRQFADEVYDEKHLVHHKDFNKLNNSPDNLIWMSKEAHHKIHHELNSGAYSEEANAKRAASIANWHKNAKGTECYELRSKHLSESILKYYGPDTKAAYHREYVKQVENIFGVNYDELTTSERLSIASRMAPQETRLHHNQQLSEKHAQGCYQNAKIKLQESNEKLKNLKKLFPEVDKAQFQQFFGFDYDSLPSRQRAPWVNRYRTKMYDVFNHTITNIEIISVDNIPVYDLEIEDNHNFALEAGIFVHNSHKDLCDAVCGSMFTASKHAEEFAYEYGETIDYLVDTNNQISESKYKEELNAQFEQALIETFDTTKQLREEENKKEQSRYNQGFDSFQNLSSFYISQGILI